MKNIIEQLVERIAHILNFPHEDDTIHPVGACPECDEHPELQNG